MKISSTQRPAYNRSSTAEIASSNPLDGIRDTFHRGYIGTMVALPGIVKGGMLGAAIGFTNSIPLALFHGLGPTLAAAAVGGTIGAAAGGALYLSLARLD